MKTKFRYEKQELTVGLSEAVPLAYESPEQKYLLADSLERSTPTHVKYVKNTFELEFDSTTDELLQIPERVLCYRLITAMPDIALHEVEEELRETYVHYLTLIEAKKQPQLLPAPQEVIATVIKHVKT